jgi:hypothetical protein
MRAIVVSTDDHEPYVFVDPSMVVFSNRRQQLLHEQFGNHFTADAYSTSIDKALDVWNASGEYCDSLEQFADKAIGNIKAGHVYPQQ